MRNRVASLERKRKRFPANNQLDSDDSLVRSVSWGKSFIKELVFALSSYVPPTGLLVFLRCLLILQSSYSQIRFREAGTRCVAGIKQIRFREKDEYRCCVVNYSRSPISFREWYHLETLTLLSQSNRW